MMSMLEWAKNEVAIASKRERGDNHEGEWDYGCACYDSAMRAFESLLGDGHSGMSIGFTKNILDRLIDGKPLTPIEDTEEVWEETCINRHNGFVAKIYNEMYPLTLPYMPNSRPDVIVCDELLTDRKNGDCDTLAILYIKKADGERVEVNRYFKESEVSFTEISPEEYKERQRLQEERIKNEAEK